jgi:serine/threonine protein kinase
MSDADKSDGAGEQSPTTPGLPLRPAAPARPNTLTDLRPDDPLEIDDYRLLGQLGIGGMGTVYLGQSAEGSKVAIKLVHTHLARDARFRIRFAGEVRAAQQVPGFCTARVLGSGSFQDRPYLVTEYLEGVPLSRLVATDGPLDPATLHSISIGVAAALAAIHGAGLVHRDLKPSNLMVTLGGVRIIDFGIARAMDIASDVTGTGNIVGSLGWASPEQLRAEEPRTSMDIFGWGCLVAFAATGRHPFGGEEAAARAWKILEGDPDLSGIPDPIRNLVAQTLNRNPDGRPTAKQLLLALAVNDTTEPPTMPGRRWLSGPSTRRRATTMAVAVPMAVALIFAVAETTSELLGGSGSVADAGGGPHAATGGNNDTSVLSMLSPQANPPGTVPSQSPRGHQGNNARYGPTSLPTGGLPTGTPVHTVGPTTGPTPGSPTDIGTSTPPTETPSTPADTPSTPADTPSTPADTPSAPAVADTNNAPVVAESAAGAALNG